MKILMMRTMNYFAVALVALALVVLIAPGANAAKGPKVPSYHGHVTAVDATAGTITIEQHKLTPMTFTVNSSTKVMVEKQASTLASIQVGYACHIRSTDGKTALVISAHPKVPHVKTPKGAAKPATL